MPPLCGVFRRRAWPLGGGVTELRFPRVPAWSVIVTSNGTTEAPSLVQQPSVFGLFCQSLAFCCSWKQCNKKVSRFFFFFWPFLSQWPAYIFAEILSPFLPPLPLLSFLLHLSSFLPSFLPSFARKSVSKPKNDVVVIYAALELDMTFYEQDFKGQKYSLLFPITYFRNKILCTHF